MSENKKKTILIVEDEEWKDAVALVSEAGYDWILVQTVSGYWIVSNHNDPDAKPIIKNTIGAALAMMRTGLSLAYYPGVYELLECNNLIVGVLLDLNFPLFPRAKEEKFGKGVAEVCANMGMPCVICTANNYTPKHEHDYEEIYHVPVIGHKNWKRAMTRLHELITAKV